MDRVKNSVLTFLKFLYNRETHEVLGRTLLSWVKILSFYTTLYVVLGSIFMTHLVIFLEIGPKPDVNVTPWNFGRYGYANYPNAKIDFILTPDQIILNSTSGKAQITDKDVDRIRKLVGSARISGVNPHCLQESTRFGFNNGTACLFLHITKVFKWTPELIAPILKNLEWLDVDCTFQLSHEHGGFRILSEPPGIPLNLPNNENGRSYPFNNHPNYTTPILGLLLDLTRIPSHNIKRGHIYCNLDFIAVNKSKPPARLLKRLYEIPAEATIVIHFRK